ncbi:hypothetical protein L1049_008469 [Liquidambar formosana]|uniref:Uncharacterized protein n=1 Tax=Liquidambar formosana TaxID=63359 RepID=A0AAP0X5M5_LIQFO
MYSIGELKTLIILSFNGCSIVELPAKIGNLTHLKLLDLTHCSMLKRISPEVISRLKQLEELYLERSGLKWVVGEEGKQENEVNLEELGSLRNLIALTTLLPTADFPGSNSLFKNLLSFRINISPVTFPSTELFPGHVPVGSLHELRTLHVQGCNKLLNVVPSYLLQGLSNLKVLTVTDCASMVEVTFPSIELHGLRLIQVQGCNKLLNVVPSDLLQGLSNLVELSVTDCASLVEVFEVEVLNVEESDIVPLSELKELYLVYLPKLTHILKREPKGTLCFQSLTVLYVWNCNKLRNLFSASIAKSAEQLQELGIEKCKMMEEIVIKGENEEEYRTDKITMPQLKRLKLFDLPNLTSFCRDVNAFDLPSLKHVTIEHCPKMKTPPFGFASTPKPTELEYRLPSFAKSKYEDLVHNVVEKQLEVNESSKDDGNDSFDDEGDGDGDGDDSSDDRWQWRCHRR